MLPAMLRAIGEEIELIATVASALLAAIALAAAYLSYRRAELRRDDVLEWAHEAIAAMQALRLICTRTRLHLTAAEERARLSALMFDTSILVERGRLYFGNARRSRWRQRERERAYRGKRPEILDQLVIAHQIACGWPTAPADDRARMRVIADDVLRRFVSLVQAEVGRTRTASADTRRGGNGANLGWRMRAIDPARLVPMRGPGD